MAHSPFTNRLLKQVIELQVSEIKLVRNRLERAEAQILALERLDRTLSERDAKRVFLEIELEKLTQDVKTLESGARMMAERGKILSDLPDVCEVLSRGR